MDGQWDQTPTENHPLRPLTYICSSREIREASLSRQRQSTGRQGPSFKLETEETGRLARAVEQNQWLVTASSRQSKQLSYYVTE
jgi:hypothetical protein